MYSAILLYEQLFSAYLRLPFSPLPRFVCPVLVLRAGGEDVPAMEAGDEQLLPMPLSPKMRELMVWTTDMVLPVLGASGDRVDDMAADSTPGVCGRGVRGGNPANGMVMVLDRKKTEDDTTLLGKCRASPV